MVVVVVGEKVVVAPGAELQLQWCSGCCWPSARPKAIAGGFPGKHRGDTEAGTAVLKPHQRGEERAT